MGAKLNGANLSDCRIYGISVWNVELDEITRQTNLIVTPEGEPTISIDNINIAQFVYLILHNEDIRKVIDTITSKVVLILGRFIPERKEYLEAVREVLRNRGYVPVVFDFEKPSSRNALETVRTF